MSSVRTPALWLHASLKTRKGLLINIHCSCEQHVCPRFCFLTDELCMYVNDVFPQQRVWRSIKGGSPSQQQSHTQPEYKQKNARIDCSPVRDLPSASNEWCYSMWYTHRERGAFSSRGGKRDNACIAIWTLIFLTAVVQQILIFPEGRAVRMISHRIH